MPVEFTIVGEHVEDPTHLLVLGADGAYYAYDPAHERLAPTEPDAQWHFLPAFEDATIEASATGRW
jgi:hypothetical protein